jgi:PAS domain S-box-containing protein
MSAMRKSGIDIIGDVTWGTHFCQFYQTKSDLVDILVPYFKAGLDNNEFCIWVTHHLSIEEAQKALEEAVPNIHDYLMQGQIEIISHKKWYLKNGRFDANRVLNGWIDKLKNGQAHGFEGLRVTAGTFCKEKESWKDFVVYKEKLDELAHNYPMIVLCTCSLEQCSSNEIIEMVSKHKFALAKQGVKWELIESSEFKRVEKELLQYSEMLSSIFNLNPDAIALTRASDGKFIDCNQRFLNQIGYSREEVIGHTSLELNLYDHEDRQRYIDKIPKKDELYNFELRLRRKDGSAIDVLYSSRFIILNGEQIILNIGKDISSRKKSEVALEEGRKNLELKVQKRKKELKSASNYNRSLIEASVDPLVTIGPNGKITDVNKSTESVTGYSRDDLIGSDFSDYFTEPEKAREGYQQVFQNGTVMDYPLEIKHKNGHITPVLYNASVYLDDSGSVVGVFAAARDITEVKKAEEEIQKLANIVESSDDAIISKTFDGIITSWNEGAKILYGYSQDEIIGKNISILIPPDLKEEYKQFTKQILRGERVYHYERERIRKDGKLIDVSLTLSPIFDLSGKLVGISIIARDISIRKKAEKKLEYANKYNRSLIEASVDPLVTIGPDGKITDVNLATESITGFSRSNLINTDFSDYFTEPEKAREGYQQVFQNGTVMDYPLEIKHKNGHITPVLYNASVYRDDNDEIIGVFAAARDITELKKAEYKLKEYQDTLEEKVKKRTEELANSNKELEQFAYITSHDLREPLRMITNFLQLLERRYTDQLDQDAKEFIGFAVDGAKRLDNMTNDLLSYSRITTKKEEINTVNFENVLEEALINLKVPIEENNAVITHDPLPKIQGNGQLKVQLFQNIIGNAIKYRSQETPKIHISSKKEKNQYVFSIKDNGIGMAPEHLEKIFTIFKRLHTHEKYEGTGIGLAIAEKIVHQQGGEIWVESEQGKGSTFYFTIQQL